MFEKIKLSRSIDRPFFILMKLLITNGEMDCNCAEAEAMARPADPASVLEAIRETQAETERLDGEKQPSPE